MAIFQLLAEPEAYYPCRQDMLRDAEFREYWLNHFIHHFELTSQLAKDVYGVVAEPQITACHAELAAEMEALRAQPDTYGELNLQVLGTIRQRCLSGHDIADPYEHIKQQENARCVTMFAPLVRELDCIKNPREALEKLVLGVFAGNIFDLGASATAAAYKDSGPAFLQVRDGIARPWLIDHFQAFTDYYFRKPPRKAVMFVDNAGCDIILGIIPLARWLAQRDTEVVLLANDAPALNDITAAELRQVMSDLAGREPVLKQLYDAGIVRVAGTGGGTPLIDLRSVSDDCNAQCASADLVLLEGMGRSLESNFDTPFLVPCIKVCMIKEPIIAQRMGGRVFDVIFRFDEPK